MSTNEQYFKYIDKDKILPELDNRIKAINDSLDRHVPHSLYERGLMRGLKTAYQVIIDDINNGMYSWQRGSE